MAPRKSTDNAELFRPTGVYLGEGKDRLQIFLNRSKASRYPLVFEAKAGEVTESQSFADARRRYDNLLAEREAIRQARTSKQKQRKTDPVPVSVVSISARTREIDGDYLLAGYHASQKTPLLRSEDGSPVKYTPTDLGGVHVLHRLSPEQWAEWSTIKDARLAAESAVEAMGQLAPDSVTFWPGRDQLLELRSYRDREPRATVAWSLVGETFTATVFGKQCTGQTLDELGERLLELMHPDIGKDVLIVVEGRKPGQEEDEQYIRTTFEVRRWRDKTIGTDFYLGLTEEEYRETTLQALDAKIDMKAFTKTHRYQEPS